MKRKNPSPTATVFVVLVWTSLILLVGKSVYDNLTNMDSGSLNFTIKSMGDLLNGNP